MNEDSLTTALARQAEEVRGVPLSFEDVRGRAVGIRRRRRTAGAVAAAFAVAAIVVPTVLLSPGSDRSAPDPAPSPPAATVPGASVLHDGVVTRPDGSEVAVDVDNEDVQDFGVLADGRIVVATSKPYAVSVYSPDGRLARTYQVQVNAITMSADDNLAAWVGENYGILVLESGVAEPTALRGIPMPGEAGGSIDAVYGSDCAAGGCTVLGGDYSTTTTEVTTASRRGLVTPEPLRVVDVSPDGKTWAVDLAPGEDEQFGCAALYDVAAHKLTARNCATSGLRFSPDGQHLIGLRGDNNMYGEVDVFDLDLAEVGSYSPASQVVSRAAWADATHLIVSVAGLDHPQWSLVRVGLDGRDPEVVEGPVPGASPEQYPEFLPSR